MTLGYRSPFTLDKADGLTRNEVLSHSLVIEALVKVGNLKELRQYIYELQQGLDPRESEWFDYLLTKF